jgi:arylsulfatase A-like enzyme
MYSDVEIPLPEPESAETIGRLPLPVQKLILRGKKPEYAMDRTQLQWLYRSYYGTVSHLDREVGLILDALKEAGLNDTTIVVFTSDHGDQLLEHGLTGKNVFFEASIRAPLMIRHPDAKMVRTRRWKYNYYPEGCEELYDLEGDPQERRNLAGDPACKSVVDDLRRAAHRFP